MQERETRMMVFPELLGYVPIEKFASMMRAVLGSIFAKGPGRTPNGRGVLPEMALNIYDID